MPSISTRRFPAGLLALLTSALLLGGAAPAGAAWDVRFNDSEPSQATTEPDWITVSGSPAGVSSFGMTVSRGGAVVASSAPGVPATPPFAAWGFVALSALQPGDLLQLTHPVTGAALASFPYSGAPAVPGVCAGAVSAVGVRGATDVFWAGVFPPEGSAYGAGLTVPRTTIVSQGGSQFALAFSKPLTAGQLISANASEELADRSRVLTWTERLVHDCSVQKPIGYPGAKGQPPLDTTPPAGSVARPKNSVLRKLTIAKLVSKGFTITVTSDAPATARAQLIVRTKTKKRGSKRAKTVDAVLGTTTKAIATTRASLKIKLAKKGAAKLRRSRKLKGARFLLQVTLTDAAGNKATLPAAALPMPKR